MTLRLTWMTVAFSLSLSAMGGIRKPHVVENDLRKSSSSIELDHFDEAPRYSSDAKEQRMPKSTLHFTGPSSARFTTPLSVPFDQLHYFGKLVPEAGGHPFFLVAGKTCTRCLNEVKPCLDCSEEQMIYAIRPSNTKPVGFVYPGRILDSKTREVVFESRFFFGKCLPHRGELIVRFEKSKNSKKKKKLQSSVYMAEASQDYLIEMLLEKRHAFSIRSIEPALKSKQCREIPGENRVMTNKLIDLQARRIPQEEAPEEAASEESPDETSN